MFVHDIIKILYVREGYLIDYPPHLISDEEMIEGFLNKERDSNCFMIDRYPEPNGLSEAYTKLLDNIESELESYLKDRTYQIPDWVYSYMLGAVVSSSSDIRDRHELLVLLNKDNTDDELTDDIFADCLEVSSKWVKRYSIERAPTMFGEPHVIKALRLLSA